MSEDAAWKGKLIHAAVAQLTIAAGRALADIRKEDVAEERVDGEAPPKPPLKAWAGTLAVGAQFAQDGQGLGQGAPDKTTESPAVGLEVFLILGDKKGRVESEILDAMLVRRLPALPERVEVPASSRHHGVEIHWEYVPTPVRKEVVPLDPPVRVHRVLRRKQRTAVMKRKRERQRARRRAVSMIHMTARERRSQSEAERVWGKVETKKERNFQEWRMNTKGCRWPRRSFSRQRHVCGIAFLDEERARGTKFVVASRTAPDDGTMTLAAVGDRLAMAPVTTEPTALSDEAADTPLKKLRPR